MLRSFLMRSAFLFFALAACTSSSGAAPDAGADDGAVVSCANDPRVDTYTANMTKASKSGAVKVTLVASDPAPPAIQTNKWTIKVTDANGAAIPGATIAVAPFMPDHGHPTSVKPVITANADGTYRIDPLYLFMPGVWRITISVGTGADAGATEDVAFFFCIQG